MPYTTRELFARLIKCEAGDQGIDGMRAVATVVMNRANIPYGEFFRVSQGGNVRNIIDQPRQFVCRSDNINGEYNPQNIWNTDPEEIHYELADEALSGQEFSPVGNSLYFFNPYSERCPNYFPPNGTGVIFNKIHEHCFYIPTQKYIDT